MAIAPIEGLHDGFQVTEQRDPQRFRPLSVRERVQPPGSLLDLDAEGTR